MFPEKMIYPVFLPHAGCPFQCVYCNQRVTVSCAERGSALAEFVRSRLADYAGQVQISGIPGEIAFYGGTFTALPPGLVDEILCAASVFVDRGVFTGVRFSTRPDCLDITVVDMLSRYPVRTVELGAQSLSDLVLQKSGRGYLAEAVVSAAKRIKRKGWRLGVQLMAGLPGDDPAKFMESMRRAIALGADFLRIYPTLVLEGTELARAYRQGLYVPLSLDEAVELISPAYDLALRAGVPIIRMGLQADPALEKPGVILAGPYHPAFGSLVKSRWWQERIDRHLSSLGEISGEEMIIRVAPNRVSDVIGHRKSNLLHWKSKWSVSAKVVGDADLTGIEILWKTKSSNRDISL
ncbi:MAG: radical SAM protein [Syntrophobacteraceae bacterium]|nr:radical SAM protein [Syntrophobacteraceae bacterium]